MKNAREEFLNEKAPRFDACLHDWLLWQFENDVAECEMTEEQQQLLFVAKKIEAINKNHALLMLPAQAGHYMVGIQNDTDCKELEFYLSYKDGSFHIDEVVIKHGGGMSDALLSEALGGAEKEVDCSTEEKYIAEVTAFARKQYKEMEEFNSKAAASYVKANAKPAGTILEAYDGTVIEVKKAFFAMEGSGIKPRIEYQGYLLTKDRKRRQDGKLINIPEWKLRKF